MTPGNSRFNLRWGRAGQFVVKSCLTCDVRAGKEVHMLYQCCLCIGLSLPIVQHAGYAKASIGW